METGDLHISVARVRVTGSASVLVSVADSDACDLVACTASALLVPRLCPVHLMPQPCWSHVLPCWSHVCALLILCLQVESGVRQVAWSEAWQQAEAGLDEQLLSISTELRDKEVSEGAAQR